MTRRHMAFPCEGSTLVGTLDEGRATTGLLLVTGGNSCAPAPGADRSNIQPHARQWLAEQVLEMLRG